jgi:DNA-binding NtrC family response regulator
LQFKGGENMKNELKKKILYVDDVETNLELFRLSFQDYYEVITADSGEKGLETLKDIPVEVIISDQVMPGLTGLEFIEKINREYPKIVCIILTAYPQVDIIMNAINQGGVYRFLSKPWNKDEIINTIENAFEAFNLRKQNKELINNLKESNEELRKLKEQTEEENIYLKEEIKLNNNFEEIVTQSPKFKKLLNQIENVALTDASVLIQGETGTGKELVARAIHGLSSRKGKPLIKLNCAAIPETLIETELFGHEKGAFTGAIQHKKGRFELADKGTLFLDEIGELPALLQPKLLRVLQEGEFEKIGGTKTIKVNVRIISATNSDLEKDVKDGTFRNDLFYRLNVFPIQIPPLRERKKDVPLLVQHFIKKFNKKNNKQISSVSKDSLDTLSNYAWPGNVRELENVIERGVIISTNKNLKIDFFIPQNNQSAHNVEPFSLNEVEKLHIIKVLEHTEWKISGKNGAAEILKIKPTTLHMRMQKLGIKKKYDFN